MNRKVIITKDGSTTIKIPELNEQYHSIHGAIQEAKHVFIKNGLNQIKKNIIDILEIGFGTGLNCFITLLESNKTVNYVGIEAYPVKMFEIEKLNYTQELKAENQHETFTKMHVSQWNQKIELNSNFNLTKRKQFFKDIDEVEKFDIIYFDAFGARVQPELWTESIFRKMYIALKDGGIIVTYSAKGSVRRAMQSVGFNIERLEGPPGKREMLRGTKNKKKQV